MKILTRKYLLGRVAHGSGGHYCFISPIQHIMHYFTQNMPTTPLQQETSHIRMPLDARSMGSARQTGHTPHSRTSRSFIQKARGQYCFISPTQHTMHYFIQNMPQALQQKAPLTGCLLGKIHGFGRTTRHTPHGRTSATPSPQRMKILTRKYLLGRVAHECGGHYCFISPTQNTTRVIYLGLSRPALPRTP